MYQYVYNVLLYLGPGSTKTNQFSSEKPANLISCGRWRGRNQAASAVLLLFSLSISRLSGSEKDAKFSRNWVLAISLCTHCTKTSTSYPFKCSPLKCLKSETSLVQYNPSNVRLISPTAKDAPETAQKIPSSKIWKRNRGRREREKLAAMLFTAGSTLFLPFKSGAKVGPISRRLLLVSASFPLFLLAAGEIQHAT